MKKFVMFMFLFAAIGTFESQAQYRQTVYNDSRVYSDNRGTYRYEVREQRVWVPEYRTSGLFGIGSRRVPGHYEVRPVRVKVYMNQKGHPHGMPPGQRKKLMQSNRYDDRDFDRGRNGGKKGKRH